MQDVDIIFTTPEVCKVVYTFLSASKSLIFLVLWGNKK